jgi:hypothetical protein
MSCLYIRQKKERADTFGDPQPQTRNAHGHDDEAQGHIHDHPKDDSGTNDVW